MLLKPQILSTEGVKWVGWCKTRLTAIALMRKPGQIFKKNYAFPGGVFAQIISSDICDIIRIWGGAVGFICHPRSDSYPGGISSEDDTAIPAAYAYPLVDDDHGSVVLTPSWDLSTDVENYGNIDWLDADGAATSWRGPSGRSLAMDSLIDYPGFTIFDYETAGELPVVHYTPYQNLVYQGGEVYLTFPDEVKVLGSNGVYIVIGVDYSGQVNPDGGIGGFYAEVWEGIDKRIGWLRDSRPTAPWFFNQLGTEAVSDNKQLTLAQTGDVSSVIFGTLPSGAGTETKVIASENWGLTRNGSYFGFYDYAGNILANVNLVIVGADSSLVVGGGVDQSTSLGIYYCGVQATSVLVTGPEDYAGPEAYTATLVPEGAGTCAGGFTWTYPTGCGMGTVTATYGGVSGSMQVRMPDGVWVNGDVVAYGDGTFGTGNLYQLISEGSRYNEWAFGGCGTNMNGDTAYPSPMPFYVACIGSECASCNSCAGYGYGITTYYCNTSHGYPEPTLPDMSGTCEPNALSRRNCEEPYDCIPWYEAIPNCWYLTHSRIDTWECP